MYDSDVYFNTYLKQTTEKRIFIERMRERLRRGRLRSLLDLGCHDGAVTIEYLNDIMSGGRSVEVVCVDPSAASIESFKKKALGEHISFVFHVQTAEEFLRLNTARFDWIVCSHSLYWSRDLKGTLEKMLSVCDNLVIVLRDRDGLYEVQTEFKHLVGNRDEQFYNADDIEKCLTALGESFEREDIVSEIMLPNVETPAFADLASFILQTSATRLTKTDIAAVHEFMSSRGVPFPHHVSFFWMGTFLPSRQARH